MLIKKEKNIKCFFGILIIIIMFSLHLTGCNSMSNNDSPSVSQNQHYTVIVQFEDITGEPITQAEIKIEETNYVASETEEGIYIFEQIELEINENYIVSAKHSDYGTGQISFTTEQDQTEIFPEPIIAGEEILGEEYADIEVTENTETDVEGVLVEGEEALEESTINVDIINDDEIHKYVKMNLSETPDYLLYRSRENEWFKYIGFGELDEGEIYFQPKNQKIEVLPIRMEAEAEALSNVSGAREGPFVIKENSRGNLVVELGKGFFKNEPTPEGYVILNTTELEEGRLLNSLDSLMEETAQNNLRNLDGGTTIDISGLENGRYTIYVVSIEDSWNPFSDNVRVFWEQDIFVNNLYMTKRKQEELANKYAPFLFFNSDEQYFPMDLESIFSTPEYGNCVELFSPYSRSGGMVLANDRLIDMLPYYGHRNVTVRDQDSTRLRKEQGSISDSIIYYSIIPRKEKYYLNYHMLYTFDPKSPQTNRRGWAEHIFDRESATVVLDSQLNPKEVIYGAHLDSQYMKIKDNDNISEWSGGGISIEWKKIMKIGNHPILSIAQGAHAVYPVPENYRFDNFSVKTSFGGAEYAGDWKDQSGSSWKDKIAYPPNFAGEGLNSYSIKDLFDDFPTENFPLNFSGEMVPILDPSIDIPFSNKELITILNSRAKFPPFTAREVNPEGYTERVFSNFNITEDNIESKSFEILEYLLSRLHKAKPPVSDRIDKLEVNEEGDDIYVDINWQSPTLINTTSGKGTLPDGYRVYRREPGEDYKLIISALTDSRFDEQNKIYSFRDHGVKPGREYDYKIKPFTRLVGYSSTGQDYIESSSTDKYGSISTYNDEVKPAIKYKGRILVDRASPDKTISVEVLGDLSTEIETDSDGYFSITSTDEGIQVGDEIRLMVSSTRNYDTSDIDSLGLSSYVHIRSFQVEEGEWNLPELDLYKYGLDLVQPEGEETIESFPYNVEISTYTGSLNQTIYWLYFSDLDGNYIGDSSDVFDDERFNFDGTLVGGDTLDQDASWYLAAAYEEGDYLIEINTFGTYVYLENDISAAEIRPQSEILILERPAEKRSYFNFD